MGTYHKDPVIKQAYDADRLSKLKTLKICKDCAVNPVQNKKTRCESCLLKRVIRRAEHQQKGLCNSCSNERMSGKSRCVRCWCSAKRSRLGLSISEGQRMFDAHNSFKGRCQCCGDSEPGGSGNWHSDHCHKTLKFRGILCNGCNTALGLAQDNIEKLQKMINYLTKFQGDLNGA